MKNFDEIYNKILEESRSNNIESEHSEYRKSYLFKSKILTTAFVSGVLIIIILFAVLFCVPDLSDSVAGFLAICLFLVFGLIFLGAFVFSVKESSSNSPYAQFSKNYKAKVITPLIKNYDSNLEYDPSKAFPKSLYDQALFGTYSSFYSDDYISGKIGGKIPVTIGDIETTRDTSDDSTITVFEGLFAAVELPKSLRTSMLIHMDSNVIRKPFSNDDKLNMDSLGFEKSFNVYSKDKVLTMRMLTSNVLTYLLDFKSKHHDFDVSIDNNYLYIQLECDASFDINIAKDKNAVDYETLNQYYNNLDNLCELITFFYDLIEKMDI